MKTQLIRAKLGSRKGATILFALFFFIVCAVIGSIVLTAATAAAGRMKDVREINKRYYAVNSAADVLAHELDKPEMKAVIKKEDVQTGAALEAGTFNLSSPEISGALAGILFRNVNPDGSTLLKWKLMHSDDDKDPLNARLWKMINYSTADAEVKADDAALPPDTTADQRLTQNIFNRKIQLCSTDGKYSLILDCPAHIDRRQSVKTSTSVTVAADGSRVETPTTTTTTTYTITWSVASVTKGGAAR